MVFTILAVVKKKIYILPTNHNKNNKNNDIFINIVGVEKNTRTSIVPETQIQIVDATHGATLTLTLLVAIQDEVSFINKKSDAATEL